MIEALALVSSLVFSAAPTIAVMPALGDDPPEARRIIGDALAGAHVTLVDDAAVTKLIASAAASGLTCDPTQAVCAARIGAFGGLDFVVVSEVTKDHATVALHDCENGREVRKVSARLDDSARNQGLAALARAALGEAEASGRIDVTAPADGAIFVDGVAHGVAPQSIETSVGNHEVTWRSPDGAQLSRTVDVPAAAGVAVAFTPPATPAAPERRTGVQPVFVVGLAGGAVLALGGAVGAFVVAPGDRASFSARDYNDDVFFGRVLLGAAAVGAACAVVSGALLLGNGDAS